MASGRILFSRRRVHVGPRRIRRECLSPRGHQGARLVDLARLRGHHRLLSDSRAGPPGSGRGHRSSRLASSDRGWCRAAGAWRGGDGARRWPLAAPCRVCLHGARLCHDVGDRPQRDDRAVVRKVPGPGGRDGAHGASVGAMVVVPLVALSIACRGFAATTTGAAAIATITLVPLALVVLRYRGPAELGLGRDGETSPDARTGGGAAVTPAWTRAQSLRSLALWSVAVAFALGLTAQVSFFTHQVKLAEPVLGATGAGWLVGVTGLAGFLGRLLLAWVADRIALRGYAAAIFATQALALVLIAITPGAPVLVGMTFIYGFCLGQITTLSPIIVRREFGAASFGTVYGVAGTVIQLSSAFGPALYGIARDLFGSYPPVLAIAAGFELAALAMVLVGSRR